MVEFDAWNFLYPGTWVIFVVIGIPVYTAILGWFFGKPRELDKSLMALTYLVGFIISMWVGLYVLTQIIGVVFPMAR
ncbi:hypothetical protein [Natronomonas sp.]|uniref:hypothetical protein n=1 Tax=Natronomonas sp. TaxID=2184060 RepID=UPI002601D33A|nr:hypothetical protein [Natronomonas sp.]